MSLFGGCGGGEGESESDPPSTGAAKIEDPGPIHAHGLGINPADGSLFVATHTGLFRAAKGQQKATRIAGRFQDTMGFTVVGPSVDPNLGRTPAVVRCGDGALLGACVRDRRR